MTDGERAKGRARRPLSSASALAVSGRSERRLRRTDGLETRLILERLYRLSPHKLRRGSFLRRQWTRLLDAAQRYATWLVIGSLIFAMWVFAAIHYFNLLLDLESNVDTALAQITVAQQRRDHVERSLTQLLRYHAGYERDVLKDLTTLREPGAPPSDEAAPKKSLASVEAVGEQYPKLRIEATVKKVSESVVASETEVAKRTSEYNDAVHVYATVLHQFPGNVFGPLLGFRDHPHHEAKDPSSVRYREVAP